MKNEELKQIAKDIYLGKIYTNFQVPKGTNVGSIFYPLLFMDPKDLKKLIKKGMVMVYEYLDKASSRYVNGQPIFISAQFLTTPEYNKMVVYYKKIEEVMESV